MNVTIIVPSLDPDEKLLKVVEGLLKEGFRDIILVNDGSGPDHTDSFRRGNRGSFGRPLSDRALQKALSGRMDPLRGGHNGHRGRESEPFLGPVALKNM